MSTSNETTYLQEGMVKVTDRRTLIGTDTYRVSDIHSVTITKRAKDKRSIWFVIGGTFLILWSVFDQTGYFRDFFNLGVILVLIGLALAVTDKPSYVIQIRSAAGVSDILGSTDLSFIQRIVQAMDQAIAGRGKWA